MGLFFQITAMVAGALAIVVFILTIKEKGNENYYKAASGLLIAQTVLVSLAIVSLLVALATSQFQYSYVANYTDYALPLLYKLTALWGGQAGSLLLWAWLASLFIAIEVYRSRKHDKVYNSYLMIIGLFNSTFFLFLCSFVTNPFEIFPFGFVPQDGAGMNPMLQNPGMVIHPPLLYIGFVAYVIPFGHAFASSCVHDTSVFWVKASRVWSLFAWVMLTAGIVLGAWWAYVELGWGGYWAWDPVENASLFPWITGTALLHAAIIYERKARLKSWTYVLAMITFALTIFGTYLTRSGIMTDSVHSFGKSSLGMFFLLFMAITCVAFIAAMHNNRKKLKDEADFNFLSKEGVFFLAVLSFTALTVALVFYTMLPVITQNLFNNKVSVQLESYNLVSMPFFTVIFILASLGPIMAFGRMEGRKLLKAYLPVLIAGALILLVALLTGHTRITSVILAFAAAASFFSFLFFALRTVAVGGLGALNRNRRLTGAVIVHLGLALAAFGVIYSGHYERDIEHVLSPDSSFTFEEYTFNVGTVEHADGINYHSNYVPVQIMKGERELAKLYPELREYNNRPDQVFGEVAYYSMAKGDIYLILNGYDLRQNMIRITAVYQPLILWIWIGSIMMCIGGLVGMTHRTKQS